MSCRGTHVVVIEIGCVGRHLLSIHLSIKMDHQNEHIVC
jgi:hypothetical protein